MTKIFIIEGPDCAGKTTLSDRLVSEAAILGLDSYYVHRSKITTTAREEYLDALQDIAEVDKGLIILDRWHISENVYGPVMRGSSQVDIELQEEIDEALLQLGVEVIYVDTPLETVLERFSARGDDHVTDKITLARLWQRYYDLAERSPSWIKESEIESFQDLLK